MRQNIFLFIVFVLMIGLCDCSRSGKRVSSERPTTNAAVATPPATPVPPRSLPTPARAAVSQTFFVVSVHDGDTITVLDEKRQQFKIRLAGIDAPELGMDFAQVSKQHLASLVFQKNVSLDGDKVDRYGRRVAKVIAGEIDVNLEQVRTGLAWHYKKYAGEQSTDDQYAYSEAEDAARESHLGLWSLQNPTPPWERRHSKQE